MNELYHYYPYEYEFDDDRSDNKIKVKPQIQKFFKEFKSPIDEKELKILILEGIAPNYKEILEYIKQWEK